MAGRPPDPPGIDPASTDRQTAIDDTGRIDQTRPLPQAPVQPPIQPPAPDASDTAAAAVEPPTASRNARRDGASGNSARSNADSTTRVNRRSSSTAAGVALDAFQVSDEIGQVPEAADEEPDCGNQ